MNTLFLVAALAVLGAIFYAFFLEPYRVRVSGISIHIQDLPEQLDGFTICHLSDTHTGTYGRLERTLEAILAGIDADLCVITGDLIRSHEGIETLKRILGAFKPAFGLFAVPGNGDYRSGVPISQLAEELEQVGIHLLVNNCENLLINQSKWYIIGTDDPFLGLDDLELAVGGMAQGGFRLLLAHSPDILFKVGNREADLILAGHTHGGQIRLPLIGPLWLHCRYCLGVSGGYFGPEELSKLSGQDMRGVHMYVSRGLGGSGVRARFMCPPEVALVTLRRRF